MTYPRRITGPLHSFKKLSLLVASLQLLSAALFAQANHEVPLYNESGLRIFKTHVIYNAIEIYDARKELATLKEMEDTVECAFQYHFVYNPLSRIGNFFSYEARQYGQYACGTPESKAIVKSIDLGSRSMVKLTDLFAEDEILHALKADTWVKALAAEKSVDLQQVNSLQALFDMMSAYRFRYDSFALLGYEPRTGIASVRLVGYDYQGFNHTRYVQLGFLVKPRADKSGLFQQKANFYMARFDNGLVVKK